VFAASASSRHVPVLAGALRPRLRAAIERRRGEGMNKRED